MLDYSYSPGPGAHSNKLEVSLIVSAGGTFQTNKVEIKMGEWIGIGVFVDASTYTLKVLKYADESTTAGSHVSPTSILLNVNRVDMVLFLKQLLIWD